jgi:hypothetical protein
LRREPITIGGVEIKAGSRQTVDLSVAEFYEGAQAKIPVHVIHGRRPGPQLFLSAALHGDEICGVEIIRRLLKLKYLSSVRGTIIAVPVVNVFGFIQGSRYLPDRRDLNRHFPGSDKGSLASIIASLFMEEIVANSTHGIDFHTGSSHRENLPQIRAGIDKPDVRDMAEAFGAPIVMKSKLRDGSLRAAAMDKGVPLLLFEGGEALRFSSAVVRVGVTGTLSVMTKLGMIPRRRKAHGIMPLFAEGSRWVRAGVSGILRTPIKLGARVEKGQILGMVGDAVGRREEPIVSSVAGVVIGKLNLPLVHQGDAVFHIASFEEEAGVDETMDAYSEAFDPDEE